MRRSLCYLLTFIGIATLVMIIPQSSEAIEGKGQYAFSDYSTTTTSILMDCMVFIEVSPPEGGTTSPPPPQYFSQGCLPVTIRAIANDGFTFSHWEDGEGTVLSYDNPYAIVSGMIVAVFINDICPSEKIYGEYSTYTELLRYLRDNILSTTPEGQEIIRLYYEWSPLIVKAMEEDAEFKEEVKEMIDEVLFLIKGVE